jgi:hypothetical protein
MFVRITATTYCASTDGCGSRALRPGMVFELLVFQWNRLYLRGLGWVELPPDAYVALPPLRHYYRRSRN